MTPERRCVQCSQPIHPRNKAPNWASQHAARGLCMHCWHTTSNRHDTPRLTRSRDELLDDYTILRAQGHTWRQCAQRLNMTYPAFERAMLRARKDGDPRATRIGETKKRRTAA